MASGHKGVKEARFDLIPQDALWMVARVFGKGAAKYAERNWERGLKYSSIAGARDRHNALFAAGQDYDEESNLPHLAHAAWHGLVMLALYLRDKLEDDRGYENLGSRWMVAEVTNPEDIEAARNEVDAELIGHAQDAKDALFSEQDAAGPRFEHDDFTPAYERWPDGAPT
jgi:hypothetical protein